MSYQMHSIKVLLVEDNAAMLELVKSLLLSFGIITVFTADSAEKAFDVVKHKNPDLVITDWMLKPTDGIALTRRIRTDKNTPNEFVPIIMMTGFSEAARVINARDCGITEYLVKPFTARDLYRRLVECIEKPRQFVRCEDFFGPDRRRHETANFQGVDRRIAPILREEEEIYI